MPDLQEAVPLLPREARFPAPIWRELRASHMGETVAVALYDGVLAASADPIVRAFAVSHRLVELGHLARFEQLVPPSRRSRLLPMWRACGRLLGWLPARAGAPRLFAVIAAVEAWVAGHYGRQIDLVRRRRPEAALLVLLAQCRADEERHGCDAADQLGPAAPDRLARLLAAAAVAGSRFGVRIAKWV
jgi:ubiquinone biosynthesis monooxygenase Coq7